MAGEERTDVRGRAVPRAVLVAGLVVLVVLATLAGRWVAARGSGGPGGSAASGGSSATAVTVRNDTAAAVLLEHCANSCTSVLSKLPVGAGASGSIPAPRVGSPERWLVRDARGLTLGCLPLDGLPAAGAVVLVSQVTGCPLPAGSPRAAS